VKTKNSELNTIKHSPNSICSSSPRECNFENSNATFERVKNLFVKNDSENRLNYFALWKDAEVRVKCHVLFETFCCNSYKFLKCFFSVTYF